MEVWRGETRNADKREPEGNAELMYLKARHGTGRGWADSLPRDTHYTPHEATQRPSNTNRLTPPSSPLLAASQPNLHRFPWPENDVCMYIYVQVIHSRPGHREMLGVGGAGVTGDRTRRHTAHAGQ